MKIYLSALLLLSSGIASAVSPARGTVRIDRMQAYGSGCNSATVASDISTDGQALTVLFDNFSAELQNRRRELKDCRIDLNIAYPRGWSYAVIDVDFAGYASLDRGAKAKIETAYKFQSGSYLELGKKVMNGEFDDDFTFFNSLPIDRVDWSPCSTTRKTLSILTEVSLTRTNNRSTGYISVDSLDTEIKQEYSIVWRRCQPAPTSNECQSGTLYWDNYGFTDAHGNYAPGHPALEGIVTPNNRRNRALCKAQVQGGGQGTTRNLNYRDGDFFRGTVGNLAVQCVRGLWKVQPQWGDDPTISCVKHSAYD